MPLTLDRIRSVFQALFSPESAAEQARLENAILGREILHGIDDAATAGTASGERDIYVAEYACEVREWTISCPVTAAANGSNYATFTLGKRTAGGARTSLGTVATSATGFTAFTPRDSGMTPAILAAGDTLTLELTKTGTGVAISAARAPALNRIRVVEGY